MGIWSVIFLRRMADKGAGFAPPPSNPDLPPSYNESQSGVGAGGFHVPQQQQQPQVIVQYQQAIPFGPDPQEVNCPLCQSRIRTTVDKEPGVMAWIIAGILCFTGFWCCACIPCCIDSLNDVEHSCPSCKKKIGKFKPHSF